MVLVVRERGRYLFKACWKCRGDVDLNSEDIPYCIQCGKRFYSKVETILPKRKRESAPVGTNSFEKEKKYIEDNSSIIERLGNGEETTEIAKDLGVNRRRVSGVREILKQSEEA